MSARVLYRGSDQVSQESFSHASPRTCSIRAIPTTSISRRMEKVNRKNPLV